MSFRIEGNEIQTNGDVEDLLVKIRRDPRTTNPRVTVINQLAQMKARNGGYPLDLYHDRLMPIRVNNEKEEEAMAQAGYQPTYIHRSYPKSMFRRNLHPKFAKSKEEQRRIATMTPEAQRIEMATVNEGDFVEERLVKDEAEERALVAIKPNKAAGTGAWVSKYADLEPLPTGPEEDPMVTIARLEGELGALRDGARKKAS